MKYAHCMNSTDWPLVSRSKTSLSTRLTAALAMSSGISGIGASLSMVLPFVSEDVFESDFRRAALVPGVCCVSELDLHVAERIRVRLGGNRLNLAARDIGP